MIELAIGRQLTFGERLQGGLAIANTPISL
jgi:hypothetical protein